MTEVEVQNEIMKRLKNIEKNEGVKILMAIESGSRAWGFESPNSDYDVRFIYTREKDWYVSVDLEERRDVIEFPILDEIDLNGWDVRKSLRLFSKSNPTFVEWLQSPITYINEGSFREEALNLLPEIYSIKKGIYHYRSMAKNNYRGYLRGDMVPIKKYFYALRPLLSIRWIEKYNSAAPIEFDRLLKLVDDNQLLDAIYKLLEKKKSNVEMSLEPAVPILNRYIEAELNRLEDFSIDVPVFEKNAEKLNTIFHNSLNTGLANA